MKIDLRQEETSIANNRSPERLDKEFSDAKRAGAPCSISQLSSKHGFFYGLSQAEPEREFDNDTVSRLHRLIFSRARTIRRIRLRFASRTRARTSRRFIQRDEAPRDRQIRSVFSGNARTILSAFRNLLCVVFCAAEGRGRRMRQKTRRKRNKCNVHHVARSLSVVRSEARAKYGEEEENEGK